jgi:lipoate-protein ligase B
LNANRVIRHVPLDRADYGPMLSLQRSLHARRVAGETDDLMISLEHNPVFTVGRSGSRRHVLAPESVLKEHGIEIFEVERGGDITYHGPGQLVVYPIIDLRGFGSDLHWFIGSLEEAIIRTLSQLDIDGVRREGLPGVWVKERKVASLGVYVKNWVTYHGLALNVDVNPHHFRMINPCGMQIEMVSVNDLCEQATTVPDVRTILVRELGRLFGRDVVETDLRELT